MAPTNSLILTGRCISEIKSGRSKNNRDYCNFDFEFLTLLKNDDGQYKTGIIPTVTFGNLSKLIHSHLKRTDRITITGSLDYSPDFKKLSFIIDDVDFCLKNYFPSIQQVNNLPNISNNIPTNIPTNIPIIPTQVMSNDNPFKNSDS